jgi:hypothetical protein
MKKFVKFTRNFIAKQLGYEKPNKSVSLFFEEQQLTPKEKILKKQILINEFPYQETLQYLKKRRLNKK